MSEGTLMRIAVGKIRENPAALRAVNRQSEEYLGLVDSVKSRGVMNPIVVREIKDEKTGDVLYGLVDGLHRYSAAMDAGLAEINAVVINMSDGEVEEAQIIANIHKIETKPHQYSEALQRILSGNPTLTLTSLASKLSRSTTWLTERLGLLKLDKRIATLVDEGKITLTNAYALAKLPVEEQPNFVDRAMTLTPTEFHGTVHARKKELDVAKRQGRNAAPAEFVAVPHLQKLSELKTELETKKIATYYQQKLAKTPEFSEGFLMGLNWALHLDPESVEVARQKDAEHKAAEKAKKEKAAEERKRRKEEAAKKTQDALTAAV